MVFRQRNEEDHHSGVHECCEYASIEATKTNLWEFETTTEDVGCDSCTHYHNGECEVFRSVK